jgi:hypothetical protein
MNKKTEKTSFHLDLYSKNPYFLKLNKRINNKLQNLDEQKADLMINKVLGRDKVFNRDYTVFAYNTPAPIKYKTKYLKMNMRPDIKLNIASEEDLADPKKYEKLSYKENNFAKIYKKDKDNNFDNQINKNKMKNNNNNSIKKSNKTKIINL